MSFFDKIKHAIWGEANAALLPLMPRPLRAALHRPLPLQAPLRRPQTRRPLLPQHLLHHRQLPALRSLWM